MDYLEFIAKKEVIDRPSGHEPGPLNNILFDFQADIVRWAIKRGRAAIFADCGLGKSLMQLEWARDVCRYTGKDVLILAPLAVSAQTSRESLSKLDMPITVCAGQKDVIPGINITNYEKLHHFDASHFGGIVLDESSIVKNHTSKTREQLLQSFSNTPYRLACTATPSPNDFMELGNHSEFLGAMSRAEMLAMYFIHDGGDTGKWRLKGHAQEKYWQWLCSWSVMVRKPSDLGYKDDGFILPEKRIHHHIIRSAGPRNGMLFAIAAKTLSERRTVKKESLEERIELVAELVNNSDEPWVVWCELNIESELLNKAIPDAIEVKGSDSNTYKENAMMGFSDGKHRVMLSKTSIAGFGMNWQHCNNMAFASVSDSYEKFYQGTRRCWRFGQTKPVDIYLYTSELEGNVIDNLRRKEFNADFMADSMVKHMSDISSLEINGSARTITNYNPSDKIKMPSFLKGGTKWL